MIRGLFNIMLNYWQRQRPIKRDILRGILVYWKVKGTVLM